MTSLERGSWKSSKKIVAAEAALLNNCRSSKGRHPCGQANSTTPTTAVKKHAASPFLSPLKLSRKLSRKLSGLFLLSVLTVFSLAVPSNDVAAVPSSAADQDNLGPLITKVFGQIPSEKACLDIKKMAAGSDTKTRSSYAYIDDGLNTLLELLNSSVKSLDHFPLRKLFHPHLAVSSSALKNVLASVRGNLGEKLEVSTETLWALYTKDGSSKEIQCESDAVEISPQYGYDLQFGAMISILGKNEIGKIFVTIVPSNGNFYIGAFHFQMWTHKGKDYLAWVKEADEDFKNKHFMASYIKYDLAKKLIYGKTFFKLNFESKLDTFLDTNLNKSTWEKEIANSLPSDKIIHASSMLSAEGAGLMLRFLIPKELSAHDIRAHCTRVHQDLYKTDWFKEIHGVRCGYNLPHEADLDKDGFLGSIFVDSNSAAKNIKKSKKTEDEKS